MPTFIVRTSTKIMTIERVYQQKFLKSDNDLI